MADKLLKSIKFPTLPDRYVIGDSTLTEEGAAADAKATGDEITNVKSDLNTVSKDLRSAINGVSGDLLKAYADSVINSSAVIVPYSGYSVYELYGVSGDCVSIEWDSQHPFYGALVAGDSVFWINEDDSYTRIGSGQSTNHIFDASQCFGFYVLPSGVKGIAFNILDANINYFLWEKNYSSINYSGNVLRTQSTLTKIDNTWTISTKAYPRSSDSTFRYLGRYSHVIPVKSGDKITWSGLPEGLSFYGQFRDSATGTSANIDNAVFTASASGLVFAFDDNTLNILFYPSNAIMIDFSQIKNNPEDTEILDGKIYAAFGDSITAGNNLQVGEVNWPDMVVSVLGGTLVNCGVGSSRVAGFQSTAFWKDDRLNAIKNANADIVTILGGANDLVAGYSVGDESQFDLPLNQKDTSIYLGAYSYIIENLLAWKPSLQIIVLGMYYAWSDGAEYSESLTFTMLSDATKKLSEHYCLPFIDLHHDTGFNQFTMGTSPNNIYSRDKIHPNQLGCNKIASIVRAKFIEVFS